MVIINFICIGSTELFGTGQMKKSRLKYMSQVGFEPTPGTPRYINRRLTTARPHGKISSEYLQSYPDL